MTREEAIKLLYKYTLLDETYPQDDIEAFEVAIKALEQEPCEDCISRKAVLETINNRIEQIKRDANEINKSYSHLSFAEGVHDGYCRLKCDMRILSSAKPQEQKIGHWIDYNWSDTNGTCRWGIKCSQCNKEYRYGAEVWLSPNYCPNCGAKMESEG